MKLEVKFSREVSEGEVADMVTGTGALTMPWWGSARTSGRDGVTGYLLEHDTADGLEGTFAGSTWLSPQKIVEAAGKYLTQAHGDSDAIEAMTSSLGYLDASAADWVLQHAVFGEILFG